MRHLLFISSLFFCLSAAAQTDSVAIVKDTLLYGQERSVIVNGQEQTYTGAKYWWRHKTYKTCAWATLGVGGTAALVGIFGKMIDKASNENYSSESNRHWNIPIFAGLGITAVSVPLFMCASHTGKYAVQPPSTPIFIITKKEEKKPKATVADDRAYKQTKYWKRHNTFKALAWSSLGTGIAAMCAGTLVCVKSFADDYGHDSGKIGGSIFLSGVGLSVASIPLFICSYRSKYKAKEAALDISLNATAIPAVTSFGQIQTQPAFGISLNF